MADRLNVLLLESEAGEANPARRALQAAGHRVVQCHEPGAALFPCNAITHDQRCPLDGAAVDVALVLRTGAGPQPAPGEDGAVCAIRQHVPLVVAGSKTAEPYGQFATEMLGAGSDVVDACERAASAPLPAHTAAAAHALQETLARAAFADRPDVSVERRHGSLVVRVAGSEMIDPGTRSMAAVRMIAAIRALDRSARGIDVAFDAH